MSLINDALKRAKQAQQEAAPPSAPTPPLRPVASRPYARPHVSMAIPILLGIASLALVVLLWQTARNVSPPTPIEAKARTKTPAAPKPAEPAPTPALASAATSAPKA